MADEPAFQVLPKAAGITIRPVAPPSDEPTFQALPHPDTPLSKSRPSPLPPAPGGLDATFRVIKPDEIAAGDPAGVLQSLAKPFVDFWPEQQRAAGAGFDELTTGLNAIAQSPTIGGKAWGALQALGGFGSWTMSPVEAFARSFVGNQAGQITTNVTGSELAGERVKDFIGNTASLGAQVVADPVMAALKIGGAAREFVTGITPAERAVIKAHKAQMRTIIRDYTAQNVQADKMAEKVLDNFQLDLRKQPQNIIYGFMDAIDTGARQVLPDFDAPAKAIRDETKKAVARVQSLGKGILENVRDHYMAHYWANPKGLPEERGLLDVMTEAESKRNILGPQTFRKKRTIDSFMRGIEAGLKPISDDPMVLSLMKIRELNKFYYGTRMADELKRTRLANGQKLLQFYPSDAAARAALPGAVKLDNRVFKAMLPPAHVVSEAIHQTAFDPAIRRGLQNIADAFGFPIRTPLSHEDPELARAFGYTYAAPGHPVVSRFGNELQVMEHEVGHQIDNTFNLWEYMSRDRDAWRELGELALKRIDPQLSIAQRHAANPFISMVYGHHTTLTPQIASNPFAYLLSGHERMANFFHAYWYAPDLVRTVAPHAFQHFEQWMEHVGAVTEMGGKSVESLIDGVRPSLAITGEQRAQLFETVVPGWRHMGDWYAPKQVARIFNNYVSKGLAQHEEFGSYYRGIRSASNALNQSQLSLSGFHAFFTTLDTMISRTALGVEQAVRGMGIILDPTKAAPPLATRLRQGAGELGRGVANIAIGMTPIAPVQTFMRGRKLIKGYYDPATATPELAKILDAGLKGGMRVNMDKFHHITEGGGAIKGVKGLIADWKSGEFMKRVAKEFENTPYAIRPLKAAFMAGGKVIQDLSYPIMEFLVPAQKMGVMHDLAADFIRRNPNATTQQIRLEMEKINDSVDNRLGQMVYDNVFWHKATKDIAFLTVRAVGWNLGTIREIGGAVPDTARAIAALRLGNEAEFTHRMAYVAAMVPVTALYGATLTYLYTGEGPKEIKDYFFPPTGKINDQGAKERVIVPSYIKDIMEYNQDPLQTAENKINPMWGAWLGLYNNRDFYGAEIADKDGDAVNQTVDYLKYFADQMTPFSIRSARKMAASEDATLGTVLGSFGGLQAAPGFITNPELQEYFRQKQALAAKRKKLRREARP